MKTKIFSTLGRLMMAIVVITLLLSLSGGKPANAVVSQASYIVQATSSTLAASLVEKHGGTITSRLDIIRAVAANLSQQGLAELRLEKGIQGITPNGAVKSSGDKGSGKEKDKHPENGTPSSDFPEVVGADLAWGQGVTGKGVTVAVLDTGMGNDLEALTKSIDNKNGRIIAWKDFIDNSKKPTDPNGHGSHVAGIIANSEKGADGNWNGIAPGVKLVGVRVLDANGAGTYESVISGLQWVIENKSKYNIRVVNLSIVAPVQSAYWADPLDQAVTVAWANGLTVIVPAGNDGPDAMTISVPGNNPYAVTVGAFTDNYTPADWNDDYVAPFSGAGPTLDGFVKPDLVAPGAHMVSVVPAGSTLTNQYPANQLADNYFSLAGTSMSAAVVSGIAALVIAKNPSLTNDQIKQRLVSTSLPWVDTTTNGTPYSMFQQGAGRANAPDSIFASISGSANQGLDIQADMAGTTHYEGYAYYDESTGTYRLYAPYDVWPNGYGIWNGGHGAWAGGHGAWAGGHGAWAGGHGAWAGGHGAWAGGHGAWAGGHGAWAGGHGAWAGGHGAWAGQDAWAGGHGAWAGGHGAWAGGYTLWAGGHGAWAGGHGAWAGNYTDPAFISSFIAGESPDAALAGASVSNLIVEEPAP